MNLISGYPLWFIILCIIPALAGAVVLYYGKQGKRFPAVLRYLMAGFRFFIIFLTAFLLLEPLIRLNVKVSNEPVVAIVTDNSQSMISTADSNAIRSQIPKIISNLTDDLSDMVSVNQYLFSDTLAQNNDPDFHGGITNMGMVFEELKNRYINRNLAGVVIISDGINNAGLDPLHTASLLPVPIFTIPTGDTSVTTDAVVNSLNGNREVIFNNYFPIEFSVLVKQASGKKIKISASHNDAEIFNQTIDVIGNQFSRMFNIRSMAVKKGLNKISVRIEPLANETNIANNVRVFYFNVVDEDRKVTIVSPAPHPDIAAIRQALSSNLNYKVDVYTSDQQNIDLSETDLLIVHQLPQNQAGSPVLTKATSLRIPVWIILGNGTSLPAFNALNTGISVKARGSTPSTVQAIATERFSLFSIPSEEAEFIKSMPPLSAPFGDYSMGAGVDVLLFQKIGNVVSSQPLLAFSQFQQQRRAVLLGEGIWRWRLYDYQRNRSFDHFDAFFSRIAQFLSQNADRSRFRVMYEPVHSEQEPVRFTAELFNENFELINSDPVEMLIKDETGRDYRYSFIPDGSGYSLTTGKLSPGEYSFTARVNNQRYPFTQNGKFTIDKFNPELADLRADHNLLALLAAQSGGLLVHPDSIQNIGDFLEKQQLISTTYHRENKYIDLLEWEWLLFIILLFMSAEWIIRKREGYY